MFTAIFLIFQDKLEKSEKMNKESIKCFTFSNS